MSFDDRLNDMRETHALKGRDYGTDEDEYLNYRSSEEAGIPAWFNAILRVREKLTRVNTFYRKGELANESIEDALRDIATGGAIAWDLYLEQEVPGRRDQGAGHDSPGGPGVGPGGQRKNNGAPRQAPRCLVHPDGPCPGWEQELYR